MHSLWLTGLLSVLLIIPVRVHAWGLTGHRIVGAIAERHLQPDAAKKVAEVLDGYHLQDVSNWADEIKSER
ncbi:MAG TPA: S1/P1 Nuclease, partial [Proteobacteria bacterium]|nr:S1/P1 Nuclease [Pseudomonadota bacterium]